MPPSKCVCPSCGKGLKAPPPEEVPIKVKCPGCRSKFELNPDGSILAILLNTAQRAAEASSSQTPDAGLAFHSAAHDQKVDAVANNPPKPTGTLNARLFFGILAAIVALLGAGVTLAVVFSGDKAPTQTPSRVENDDDEEAPPAPKNRSLTPRFALDETLDSPPVQENKEMGKPAEPPPVVPMKPMVEINPVVKPPKPMPAKEPEKPQPAVSLPFRQLPAGEQEKVNAAIDNGVAFLKDCLDERGRGGRDVVNIGNGPVSIQHLGVATLAGLTLLACGVPLDNPAVQKAVARARKEAANETNTYVISLLILFLDQLDEVKDRLLIRMLATRLLAGQTARGGWSYGCPKVSVEDETRLLSLLQRKATLSGAEDWGLRNRYRGVPVLCYKVGSRVDDGLPMAVQVFDWNPGYDDNSTTQFAVLALWSARKLGIPVDKSLSMAEMRFRGSQNADGSWGYNKVLAAHRCDSMTCAALMGLAAGRGISNGDTRAEDQGGKGRGLANDPQVLRGLAYLGETIGRVGLRRAAEPTVSTPNTNRLFGSRAPEDIFMLWSLERMSVIYSLEKIDGKEWYPWAAKLLVNAQRRDGSWLELYGSAPNTCFALLVLKRVNVVKDLTTKLQKLEPSTLKRDN